MEAVCIVGYKLLGKRCSFNVRNSDIVIIELQFFKALNVL